MQQLDLFEETQPDEAAQPAQPTRYQHRIVIIDHHIIAQFYDSTGWWTMSKANNNDERDFAFWEESNANMRRAMKLAGDGAPIIRTDLAPVQDRGGWLIGPDDRDIKPNTPEGYRMALRQLARSIQ